MHGIFSDIFLSLRVIYYACMVQVPCLPSILKISALDALRCSLCFGRTSLLAALISLLQATAMLIGWDH